jgi:hypothetical protein
MRVQWYLDMLAMLGALDNDTTTTGIKVFELGVSVHPVS